jgi:hypothetical protein
MKTLFVAVALTVAAIPAHAEETKGDLLLQIQNVSDIHFVEIGVSIKNRTNTDYAVIAWSCDFWDKQNFLVGRGVPIVFYAVPYQSLRYEHEPHPEVTGMIAKADCKFVGAKERTRENSRLYRSSGVTLPIDAGQWWHDGWNAYTQPMKTTAEPQFKRYNNDGSEIATETAEGVKAANEKFKAEHPLGKLSTINEQCRRMEVENPAGAASNFACQELKAGRKILGITNYEDKKAAETRCEDEHGQAVKCNGEGN